MAQKRSVALSKTFAFQDARVYFSDPWHDRVQQRKGDPLTAQTTCFIITQTSTWIYERNQLLYHVARLLIQWLTETRVMILVSGKTCNIHGFDINFMN